MALTKLQIVFKAVNHIDPVTFAYVRQPRLPRKTKKLYKSGRLFQTGMANPFRDIQYSIIAIRRGYKL